MKLRPKQNETNNNKVAMNLPNYLNAVSKLYQSGISGEHAYRGDFQNLIKELTTGVDVTNEPLNATDCGNPDFVLTRKGIPIGFIEAKDVGKDLSSKIYKEQFDRYQNALDNLIVTDYLLFRFYKNSELVHEVRIGEIEGNKITHLSENFAIFANLLENFSTFISQTIKSPKKLAVMMAGKARLLENILEKAVTSDETSHEDTSLKKQYEMFKAILIHDLTPAGFADIYAQTLAYGMFAARLHDKTLDSFSRQEAAELIPKSNPFLRKLFIHVAGVDIDRRIVTTVDNLADVFRATNVEAVLKNFGKITQTQDPIIHFYETFLAEYNPQLRKARGVWYTPAPVVNFMVRSVDEILKSDFGLSQGLADTSKTSINVKTDKRDKRTKSGYVEIEKEVHKVQVLDPATGTGTFLAEVIRFIYEKKFKAMQGAWSTYVEDHLIPRINGFELLMASYSMAHLKLDMLLTETGFISKRNSRFNIFLTNSLEEFDPNTPDLFSDWLSFEAKEANHVKRETPVMVIIGNPPYSGESSNNGRWIMDLMDDYKKEPGGNERLRERNSKWINDDYVKFIRFGQHYIEKNGEGILAFINPHGFLDNPTFRGMRWNLLKTYDKIYTIDLHGNSKKKEQCPDGSPDTNVFDIQQGVSINFFIRTGKKQPEALGEIFHYDLFGSRELKYQFLRDNSIKTTSFLPLQKIEPMFFMVQKNFELLNKYSNFISLSDVFHTKSAGIVTARDKLCVHFDRPSLQATVEEFDSLPVEDARLKFNLGKDARDWKVEFAKDDISSSGLNNSNIKEIVYRPFDVRFTYYTGTTRGFHCMPRKEVMDHLVTSDENFAIICPKQTPINENAGAFITKHLAGHKTFSAYNINTIFPLSLLHEDSNFGRQKTSNLTKEAINYFSKSLDVEFDEKNPNFNHINIFDYIYATLNSPKYLLAFKDFLNFDFPRIPPPKSVETFISLAVLGKQLRQLQLFESKSIDEFITSFPIDGNNMVETSEWEPSEESNDKGRVWINSEQYFGAVPLDVWEQTVGGFQPAKKWLQDRKGRNLNFAEIVHYQRMIVALKESTRIIAKINQIEFD